MRSVEWALVALIAVVVAYLVITLLANKTAASLNASAEFIQLNT